jgi:hypothetical protein
MKRDEKRKLDWQEEVWRVKAELAAEARRMGMREYVAFVEKEADRILEARTKPSLFLARDRPATKPRRPRTRKP